ncbi:MAG: DNA mismatch repair endonuclease MutL [Rikenellaceae bacterium]
MADRINILSDVVANQIAAGEVVVRPASVVKEMMENSIDAGATSVIVNSRNGGSELIQIVDNGCGFSPNDARMAFEKHATSKISQVEDIYSLRSFGFRGEALASISAIAEIELKTRQEDDTLGTVTRIKGGVYQNQEPIMCEKGANFMVRNLFFNVPARKRFLEKSTVSTRQIRSEFARVALCYPEVDFELYANDALSMKLQPASLANRIVDVVGKHIRGNLLEVNVSTSIVNVSGYIGKPSAAKKGSSEQYMFVNGRYFKSPYIYKAIMRGYEKLIPSSLNPSFFLYLDVALDMVDVNVHPQKTEVKFIEKDAVWQIVLAAVRETLAKGGGVPLMDFDREDDIDIPVINSSQQTPLIEPNSVIDSGYNPFLQSDSLDDTPAVEYDTYSSPKRVVGDSSPSINSGFSSGKGASAGLKQMPFDSIYEEFSSASEDDIPSGSSFEFIESVDMLAKQQGEIIVESKAKIETLHILKDSYAVVVVDGELVIFDMRRVREKRVYDEIIAASKGGGYPSQRLLFAEQLTLSNIEYELMEEYSTDFALLGFDVEYKGGGEVEILGLPSPLLSSQVDTLLYELLQICSLGESVVEATRGSMASAIAHRSSLGGATVTKEQSQSLLEEFYEDGAEHYTAEGKLIYWSLNSDEIKKILK